jgi:hypothetical protein
VVVHTLSRPFSFGVRSAPVATTRRRRGQPRQWQLLHGVFKRASATDMVRLRGFLHEHKSFAELAPTAGRNGQAILPNTVAT